MSWIAISKNACRRGAVGLLALAVLLSAAGCAAGERRSRGAALKAADFILSLQKKNGAICESPENQTVNEDSDMEYALMGLGAAYQTSGRRKYLTGLERGIRFLAARQETGCSQWSGSWWYLYDADGRHIPARQGARVADVRGVDTACALFIYLLDLDRRCAGASGVWKEYEDNGRAALKFLLQKSRDGDGLTWSSFQKDAAGRWGIYRCKYAADQGDVWLAYRASARLYGGEYRRLAEELRTKIFQTFFDRRHARYCVSVDSGGNRDWSIEDFSPVQSQGYLPWLLGDAPQNRAAVSWMESKVTADGSLRCFPGDPAYTLSAALLCMGDRGIGGETPGKTVSWLKTTQDSKTGGVYDSLTERTETCNAAGFYVMALLNWEPFAKNDLEG